MREAYDISLLFNIAIDKNLILISISLFVK